MDEIKAMIHWRAELMESPVREYHKVFVEATIPEFDMRGSMTLLIHDTSSGMETFSKVIIGFEEQYVQSTIRQLRQHERGKLS